MDVRFALTKLPVWLALDWLKFRALKTKSSTGGAFQSGKFHPILRDRNAAAGVLSGHYFHQDTLVAHRIFSERPTRHIDVGSSLYGFVSSVATFRPIEVLDVRAGQVQGGHSISFLQRDLLEPLGNLEEATDSLSCLHTLEHLGLGRYGDTIDPDGWLKGLRQLHGMLKIHGSLYLSVPTGEPQRVEFNAHRVFSLPFFRDHLMELFEVKELAFVNDDGDLVRGADPFGRNANASFGAKYGLGIWILKKPGDRPALARD